MRHGDASCAPAALLQLSVAQVSLLGLLLSLVSFVGADDYPLLGDVSSDVPDKRAWNSFAGGYGKRSSDMNLDEDDYLGDYADLSADGDMEKRAWNSGFAGGMGKRAWNSGFAGGMGKRALLKRAWNSGFHGGMGKRAWNSGFAGGMGKRAWNSGFAGGMGKRAPLKRAWNSGFHGGMGKRMVENFQETANEAGPQH